MPPQSAKSLMKEFRASFRRKKVTDSAASKIDKVKELEDEELAKLTELKENIGENLPSGYNDADLVAFLRARSLHVKDAEQLLKLDVNLKKVVCLEQLLKEYDVTDLSKNFSTSGIIGCDKEGYLVRVVNIGLCDIKGFVHTMSTIEHFKVFLWFLEHDKKRLEMENRKSGRKRTQISYIIDFEGINISKILSKPVLDTGLVALKLLQDHYHDIPKSVYMINTPPLFPSVFKVFKPVIQESLHQKLKMFGTSGWKEELLKVIEADVLPAYLGGNRVGSNNDPRCREIVGMGGQVPESYFPDHFLDGTEKDVVIATVSAGSSLCFRYKVVEGTTFNFHFQAKENDIGLGLFLDDRDEEGPEKQEGKDLSHLTKLVPIIRSQCHICPDKGSFVCWFSGTLIVYFDNTYSWMSSKEVIFRVTLDPPTKNGSACNNIRRQVMVPLPPLNTPL